MSTPMKIATYALALVVVFIAALELGFRVRPEAGATVGADTSASASPGGHGGSRARRHRTRGGQPETAAVRPARAGGSGRDRRRLPADPAHPTTRRRPGHPDPAADHRPGRATRDHVRDRARQAAAPDRGAPRPGELPAPAPRPRPDHGGVDHHDGHLGGRHLPGVRRCRAPGPRRADPRHRPGRAGLVRARAAGDDARAGRPGSTATRSGSPGTSEPGRPAPSPPR